MPVPKRKRSRARRDKRFANKGMDVCSVGSCPNCQNPIASHVVCNNCGFFKGRKIIATKADRQVKRVEKKSVAQSRKSAMAASQAHTESEQE